MWVNKVGTYGVASAQFHWGRMAALIRRILYYMFPQILRAFVFVDNFGSLLNEHQATIHTAAIIVLLEALGLPLSWKKTALGQINNWLGYLVDCPRIVAHAYSRKTADHTPHPTPNLLPQRTTRPQVRRTRRGQAKLGHHDQFPLPDILVRSHR